MKKITKKLFVETLTNEKSIFLGNMHNKGIDEVESALGEVNINKLHYSVRTAIFKSNILFFTYNEGHSHLYLNDSGNHSYYEHDVNGNKFFIQKTICENDFGCCLEESINYCIYSVVSK